MCDPTCTAPVTSYLPVWNGHGDATALYRINADGSLTLANSYQYGTWGTPTVTTHNGIGDLGFRFRYVGAHDVQWDDQLGMGLAYMHARHYHPGIGRFLQPDPANAEGNNASHRVAARRTGMANAHTTCVCRALDMRSGASILDPWASSIGLR